MYNAIKKILEKNGTCLLIENGEPIGVVLTIEEYDKLLVLGTNSELPHDKGGDRGGVISSNPIGEALAQEMDYPAASANLNEIEAVDDVTLEDLGIDEEFPS